MSSDIVEPSHLVAQIGENAFGEEKPTGNPAVSFRAYVQAADIRRGMLISYMLGDFHPDVIDCQDAKCILQRFCLLREASIAKDIAIDCLFLRILPGHKFIITFTGNRKA